MSLPFLLCAGIAMAQWTSNPLENNSIASKPGEQALPKSVVNPVDGSVYICWFTTETGVYNVRLQRFDRDGNPLWADNGILVSSEPQDTWITDYDMAIDPMGYALITFMDLRTGETNPVAYRISPEGEHMWGATGIQLANNSNFDPSPKVCATTGGNAVFAWQSSPSGPSEVRLQKISPTGAKLWGDDGIILSQSGVSFASPWLFPAEGDHVFLAWHKETGPFWAPNRGLYVQKLNVDGTFMWPADVEVFAPVPSGPVYYLETCRDHEGGIIFTWYRNDAGLHFHSYVQRMSAGGQITMSPGGTLVSVTSSRNHFYPCPAYLSQSQEIVIFFSEQDLDQNQRGFWVQKMDLNGNRLWNDEGKELIPLGSGDYGLFTADGFGDRAICVYQADESGGTSSKMQAVMLDANGDYVWNSHFVDLSTVQSEKLHNVLTDYAWGQWIAVWEDRRTDMGDIYAQNIQPDGTLGVVTTAIPSTAPTDDFGFYPNPFTDWLGIQGNFESVNLKIYDSKGNLVINTQCDPGQQGVNAASLPAGLYLSTIITDSGMIISEKVVKQ